MIRAKPRWPKPLQPGDLLAIIAPASPISREAFAAGVAVLETWGLRLTHGPEIFAPRPYTAAADLAAARRLVQVVTDPEVRGIICARGGYGTIRLLKHLDLTLLGQHPKYFLGFSDITTLLCLFSQQGGVVTCHGPTVAHLAEIWPEAQEHCRRLLMAPWQEPLLFPDLQVLAPGTAQGPLLGGNLAILCSLLGTPFAPTLAGHILLLEDYNEPLYRLDRLLQQLRLSGCLQGVKAIVLGGFTGCGSLPQIWELFAALGTDLGLPVLAGLPVGHQPDNYAIPLGALVQVDAGQRTLQWLPPIHL
ncbi:MAG: S66 peptidase family protein [Desulfobacca sp.]